MPILKCKMCGGDIELSADKTFGTCEYCGSTMTFPKVDDEQRAAAFNRGNHFRRIGEFDKALAVYERIVQEDEADAEAHWCCALCRFGIEYVEDPNTLEYLPTCHRASFDSFLEDVDYLAALEHSDGITRRQYQKDAQKIAEVQRGILATSRNEEPFDVFLCYKETEDDGSRTRDSLYAQDIYYQLTEQGRRVFFSRITLEDKAGTEYEPYIFAALNSAKVMILVTTNAEHANSVWVKNEWSRFLSLMRKDRSKLLLPCYRDMDPYDLPEALSVLQSYDMSKIGFIQDLIRGVNKVLEGSKPKQAIKETVFVQQQSGHAAPLLERAFMFLEDGDWAKADEFCEQVLNLEPKNALAYLGKLMAEVHARKREQLKDCTDPFDNRNSYQKAIRFGDDKFKNELTGINDSIKARIAEENRRAEEARKEGVYHQAQDAMSRAQLAHSRAVNDVTHGRTSIYKEDAIVRDYRGAVTLFSSIHDYKDAADKEKECAEIAGNLPKEFTYHQATFLMGSGSSIDHRKAAEMFSGISGYKDADAKSRECLIKAESARKESIYTSCKQVVLSGRSATFESLFKAINGFESIADYKDSRALAKQCRDLAYSLLCRELEASTDPEALQKTHDAFIGMGDYKNSTEKARECLAKAEDCGKQRIYADALKTMNGAGDSVEQLELAIRKFASIAGWQNADELTEICRRRIEQIKAQAEAARIEAERKAEAERLEAKRQAEAERRAEIKKQKRKKAITVLFIILVLLAIAAFFYWNIVVKPQQAYNQAVELYEAERYEEAIVAFTSLNGYKDSLAQIDKCHIGIKDNEYTSAVDLLNTGEYETAIIAFEKLNGYRDSEERIMEAKYLIANRLLDDGKFEEAITAFEKIKEYSDAQDKITFAENSIHQQQYAIALGYLEKGEYEEAIKAFEQIIDYSDSTEKIEAAKEGIRKEKYDNAVSLKEKGKYDEAINAFTELGDYLDSKAQIQQCTDAITESTYQQAAEKLESGAYDDAYAIFTTITKYKDVSDLLASNQYLQKAAYRKQFEPGKSIKLGKYEQDNNTKNGAETIEWIVLKRDRDKALLISKYALDCLPFQNVRGDGKSASTWANSYLRKWLNNEFYNTSFSAQEKKEILLTDIKGEEYRDWHSEKHMDEDTQDRVFLLSLSETQDLFDSPQSCMCKPTKYAISKNVYVYDSGTCIWWLRTPGRNTYYMTYVDSTGYTDSTGAVAYSTFKEGEPSHIGVRPALWIDIGY